MLEIGKQMVAEATEMMKLIVFAVEQGLCAYIRTPNDYGVLIDCGISGSGETASPAQWLADNEAPSLAKQGDSAVSLIVTHPHENHVRDIDTVARLLRPTALCCDADFDWAAIPNVESYRSWLSSQPRQQPLPDFGATVRCFSLNRQEAERLGGNAIETVNNRSMVTVVSYSSAEGYSWKVVVAGDNQTEGWEALLANPEFAAEIKDADFFVTSCHGEERGFCAEVFEAVGKPIANISCSRVGGERPDARYKKNAQGVKFPDGSRTHFITPDDGNITVEMRDDGRYDVWLLRP